MCKQKCKEIIIMIKYENIINGGGNKVVLQIGVE